MVFFPFFLGAFILFPGAELYETYFATNTDKKKKTGMFYFNKLP